jgi:hypothetical protein
MLTNHVPFDVEEASPFAIMLKQISESVPDPRQWREDIPRWLVSVILKSLDKKPANRFVTAGEFAEALQEGPAAIDQEEQLLPAESSEEQINIRAIRKQLQQLPQRAIVCWACRCARRVQTLNADPRVERALAMAEATVTDPDGFATGHSLSLSRALTRVRSLRVASLKAAYTEDTPVPTEGIAEAARAAAAAASAAAARCIDDAAADAAFAARNAVAALRGAGNPIKPFWEASRKDYQKLLQASKGQEGTVGKPIPPDFFDKTDK